VRTERWWWRPYANPERGIAVAGSGTAVALLPATDEISEAPACVHAEGIEGAKRDEKEGILGLARE